MKPTAVPRNSSNAKFTPSPHSRPRRGGDVESTIALVTDYAVRQSGLPQPLVTTAVDAMPQRNTFDDPHGK
jgi:hypothetical protein